MRFHISRRSMVKLLGSALVGVSGSASRANPRARKISPFTSWVVFYGEKIDIRKLMAYDIAVLDTSFQGSIQALNDAGTQTFGYLSLGEVEKSNAIFPLLTDPSILLDENLNWPGTHRVDVRNPVWKALVIDKIIPSILSLGFTGIFFDTLDAPSYLEEVDGRRFKGMRAAAIDLVKSIRREFPQTSLIMNRGYDLLPDVHEDIDAILAESLLTGFKPKTHAPYLLDDAEVAQQLRLLRPAVDRLHPLPILSLDYWDPKDTETIRKLYSKERALGHVPYVATRLLDDVFPEPH